MVHVGTSPSSRAAATGALADTLLPREQVARQASMLRFLSVVADAQDDRGISLG